MSLYLSIILCSFSASFLFSQDSQPPRRITESEFEKIIQSANCVGVHDRVSEFYSSEKEKKCLDPLTSKSVSNAIGYAWFLTRANRVASKRTGDLGSFESNASFLTFYIAKSEHIPPKWWSDLVKDAKLEESGWTFDFEKFKPESFETKNGFDFFGSIKCKPADKNMIFSQKSSRISVGVERLNQLSSSGRHYFSATVDASSVFLVCFGGTGRSFEIHCDNSDGSPKWKSSVWATGIGLATGNGHNHAAELVSDESRVFVYGSNGRCIYCECFDKKTGKNVYRFNSGFWKR